MQNKCIILYVLITIFAITITFGNDTTNDVTDVKNTREPLKLYPKQKAILNQLLQFYAINNVINNTLCKKHTEEFKIGLRAFESWSLKMFDSSSKLQAGIFNGNLMDYGAFKQCINIYYETLQDGPLRGKYCLVKITPTENIVKKIVRFRNVSNARFEKIKNLVKGASLLWSVCVPDSCNYNDVQRHFNKTILSVTQGLDLNVTVKEYDCYALKDLPPLSRGEWFVIFLLTLLLTTVAISTIIDVTSRNDTIQSNKFAKIFSAYTNTKYLIKETTERHDETDCLNGFRTISMFYVVCGHRFLMLLFFPTVNGLEINEWLNNYSSSLITGATVCVDTFFMISGLLVCYQTCLYLSKGHKFQLSLFYLHRYLRITPSLGIVIVVLATLSPRFGSGPLWKSTIRSIQKPCQIFWWSALLNIQNYVNPRYMCVLQTWYLTCDMQYYLYSPLLVYPLYKWPVFGYVMTGLAYFASVGISFYIAWQNKFKPTDMTTNDLVGDPFFLKHYITPHTRAPTYILGVLFGYFLYRTKGTKIKLSRSTLIFGWLTSTALVLSVFTGFYVFQLENYPYNRIEQSIFLALARSGWTVSMIWIVWICIQGYGGIINDFLCLYPFRILTGIGYSVYLIHLPYQLMRSGALKMPMYFSNMSATTEFFGEMIILIVPSYLLTIFVEYPITQMKNIAMKRATRKVKPLQNKKIFVQ